MILDESGSPADFPILLIFAVAYHFDVSSGLTLRTITAILYQGKDVNTVYASCLSKGL